MTADWVRLPYEALARLSSRIAKEMKGVNWVLHDVSGNPSQHHRVGIGRPARVLARKLRTVQDV